MTHPTVLGQMHTLHELTSQLLISIPAKEAVRQYHPELGSLAWYFAHGVYLETYWLRQFLCGDDNLTGRVERLLTPGALPLAEQCAALPPVDHLVNWAVDIRDEHLMRLAQPGQLPEHPLLENDRLALFLLQEQARDYEHMLMVLNQRMLRRCDDIYLARNILRPSLPKADVGEVTQGHYRIGARNDPAAYDNELPPQAVELSGFRIALHPLSNSQYLAFMEADGYCKQDYWTDTGWAQMREQDQEHPEYWRRDTRGNWYGVGVNGASDLPADGPVLGISRHEAIACANWVAALSNELSGAVLQHEYQWEVAARIKVLASLGRAQEWCASDFHPYPEYLPFPGLQVSEALFRQGHASLRGANLHSQRILRRHSRRDHRPPGQRFAFTGMRLVFPPEAV